MKRCIVHFGMPKTGSSSIQSSLYSAPAELLPFTYIHLGKPNLSEFVQAIWEDDPAAFHINRKLGLSREESLAKRDATLEQLSQFVRQIRGDGLISAETLTLLTHGGLAAFGDWLRMHAEEVLAVGYIRSPKSFMESAFQQLVKGGRIRSFEPEKFFPIYRDRFEKFESVFGADNVRYWKFEPANFPGNDVVRDFCNRLGFDLNEKYIQRTNEGLSLNATRLLYIYRKHGPGYGVGGAVIKENIKLMLALANLQGDKVRFAPQIVAPLLDRYQDDVRWMEERLAGPFGDFMQESDIDISDEADLLRVPEGDLEWLAAQTGKRIGKPLGTLTPEEIAALVHELRLVVNRPAQSVVQKKLSKKLVVTPAEMVAVIKGRVPRLQTMPDDRAALLLEEALRYIRTLAMSPERNELSVTGLGVIKRSGSETDGSTGPEYTFLPQ